MKPGAETSSEPGSFGFVNLTKVHNEGYQVVVAICYEVSHISTKKPGDLVVQSAVLRAMHGQSPSLHRDGKSWTKFIRRSTPNPELTGIDGPGTLPASPCNAALEFLLFSRMPANVSSADISPFPGRNRVGCQRHLLRSTKIPFAGRGVRAICGLLPVALSAGKLEPSESQIRGRVVHGGG